MGRRDRQAAGPDCRAVQRVETRRRVRGFVLGLLADLPRKNCWTIAEHAGDRDPHGMQYLLARASWDTDGVRDDLRDYVVGALGDTDAVLVVDETGDLKKGVATVGVQRQYTGTAGRIENAQVAVYLTYAAARGHALIDRESICTGIYAVARGHRLISIRGNRVGALGDPDGGRCRRPRRRPPTELAPRRAGRG